MALATLKFYSQALGTQAEINIIIPQKPRLFIGIGTSDFLYENNFGLRKKLELNGYDFTYRESEGDHNWQFCDEYIQHVLKWMFG